MSNTLRSLIIQAVSLARRSYYQSVFNRSVVQSLICWISKEHLVSLYQKMDDPISFDAQFFWQKYEQYLLGRPLSYLTNQVQLNEIKLYVDERVLIARVETYDWVVELINWIKNNFQCLHRLKILEIGTGSGLISLLLAKHFPTARIIATDISDSALAVAQHNQQQHQVSNIKFLVGNFLKPIQNQFWKFNVVVFNPPYLSHQDFRTGIELQSEPQTALVPVGKLLTYYHQMQAIKPFLASNFIGVMELAPQQKKDVEKIFRSNFSDLYFGKDWQGHYRYVRF